MAKVDFERIKRKKENKEKNLSLKVTNSKFELLNKVAKRNNVSKSDIFEELIDTFLEEQGEII